MSREMIAEVLKEKRKLLGLSVETVSEGLKRYCIDVSPRSLYSYESGHRQPDADTLMALCEIYKIDDIMKEFGYTKKSPAPAEAESEDALKEIFDKKLERALINLGLLREGEDLTPRQRIVLEIIAQLISVNFGQSANNINRSGAVVDGQYKVG